MNELWKYIIPCILGIIIGALIFKSCGPEKVVKIPGQIVRDTVREVRADTVTEIKFVYLEPTKPYAPEPTPDRCSEELSLCNDAWERLSFENWQMGNVRARGSLALPWGSVDAEFSMPRYIQDEQDAFRFTATMHRTDSTQIKYRDREPSLWDDIGIGATAGYGGGPMGLGWNMSVGLSYVPWKISEIWR
jgi:hypothetical protein